MLHWFEQRIDPFQSAPEKHPPSGLMAFYWHYMGQIWPGIAAIMVVGLLAAVIEVSLFAYLAKLVDSVRAARNPQTFFADHGTMLLWMAFIAMIARPVIFGLHTILVNQAVTPNAMSLVRWQSHRYVMRQSLSFFQNDFAGRISSRVMQTGAALTQSVVQFVDVMWFVIIYTLSAIVLFMQNDVRLMLPLVIWLCVFFSAMLYFVPRIKDRSKIQSEARSLLYGRIVDSYTNMLTVKLFSTAESEDAYVRESLTDHRNKVQQQMRISTAMEITVYSINGLLIVATGALALWLWSQGAITLGAIALAIAMVIRINNMAGWIMFVVANIFENIGVVQEGMETIARPHDLVDKPFARPLKVDEGEIRYEAIRFHYGKDVDAGAKGVIADLSLVIKAGEKVGLVGRSGAGKSTLVNLLMRFYDLEGGRITIDGQDIAGVTQDTLRANIAMVTQDTSLLHRSVMDNIRYGLPDANDSQVLAAAARAQAHEFIVDLEDFKGRKGYGAHVGERGVKLSGGQRQRIAIARVLLKNAPILVLDEATSALDSEVEAAVQEQFDNLMQGKTVIAIAHRLSTIAAMDRLVIMDEGRIVEDGSHDELVARGGVYAALWARQSGGFLARDAAE